MTDSRLNKRQSSASSSSSRPELPRVHFSNPDIFSDDFALEPLEVADGFEPSLPRARGSQDHRRGNPSASRNDATLSYISHRPSSMTSDITSGVSMPHRTASTASTFTVPRTQSPYQGATGPSHPYGMYPQDIGLTRTRSSATSSTMRMPDRAYTGSNGPMHPYSMYPQYAVPEGDINPVTSTGSSIPVGFPGLGQDYSRRQGEDGEEADDLLGPDGYTEQLPPYTRYPDHGPPKSGGLGPASILSASRILPESSQDTLNTTESRDSATGGLIAQAGGQRPNEGVTSTSTIVDESGSFKELITEKAKKRICGAKLPLWLFVLVIIAIAALLGAVIGGLIAHKREEQKEDAAQASSTSSAAAASTVYATVTTTSFTDATPIQSIPSNLPALPTGSFEVYLDAPTSSAACLSVTQNISWSCASGHSLDLDVSPADGGPTQVSLSSFDSARSVIRYGAQPPLMTVPCGMTLMDDKDDLERGPAYFFHQTYDKIVIVSQSDFSATPSKRWLNEAWRYDESEGLEERDGPGWSRDPFAKVGDQPWFCVWNSTVLEGFIYVTQNSSATSEIMTESSGMPPPPQPSSTSFPAPASYPSLSSAPQVSTSSSGPYFTPRSAPYGKRQDPTSSSLPNPYPKIVKIEERRDQHNLIQPYCQQMQILNDGTAHPVTDGVGKAIIVTLNETEPAAESAIQGGNSKWKRDWIGRKRKLIKERDVYGNACACEWLIG